MHLEVSLAVPFQSFMRDLGFEDRIFGNSSVRNVDLVDVGIRWPP
jgi:hypothetical protein